jgi:uncharacterized protein
MATLAHLGCLVGGWLLPLIIYLVNGTKDAYVRHHAAEALNFQITFIITYIAAFIVLLAGGIATRGLGFFALFPLVFIALILNWVFGVVGAVKAYHGEWWRYPVAIRFVSGARAAGGW